MKIGTWMVAAALACGAMAAQAQNLVKLKAGMVTAIDQLGLPIALERGFFEKYGLDVTIARPYATGVDALNALQAGESEIVQVGVPMIGAVLRGMDLVALGNFSGNATKLGSDATMALIARGDSGIVKGDLKTLRGKRIATSFGTINHLYILALLEKGGMTPNDVTLVNTPPPDMTVALLAKGVDAFSAWDPWPIIAQKDVPGAVEVIRGGDVISYVGYNVATRDWVAKNGETVEKFLAAVSEADRWMRANPKLAAQVATRWIPGLKPDVAEAAMVFNIQQADRRLSANNYRGLYAAQDRLHRLGLLKSTFDVNKHIEPKHMLAVMAKYPAALRRPAGDPGRRGAQAGLAVQAPEHKERNLHSSKGGPVALIQYLTQVQFDFGAIALLQAECTRLNIRRPLLVTDAGVRAAGLVDRVLAQLTDVERVAVFDGTPPNPNEAAVRAAVAAWRALVPTA